MAESSAIEWCDSTFNPWIGCTAISPACDNCYAADWAKRYGRDFAERARTKTWGDPLKWEREHAEFFAEHGRRRRVFCASLADVFDNEVPEDWRMDLFWLIHHTPNLDWLLLTKRIGNAAGMMHDVRITLDPTAEWPEALPNVWLGATICNQEEADRDIPKLLKVPAVVRFVSIEPMLSPIDLHLFGTLPRDVATNYTLTYERLHWVIAGGESGPNARPSHPDWFRSLRDQCAAAGVPFLFKQWGEWTFIAGHSEAMTPTTKREKWEHEWEDGKFSIRLGKKDSGRLLDGVEHNGFPEAAQ